MAGFWEAEDIKKFLNLLWHKSSREENPETFEEILEKHTINWKDFHYDDGNGEWGFYLEDFKKAVNDKK